MGKITAVLELEKGTSWLKTFHDGELIHLEPIREKAVEVSLSVTSGGVVTLLAEDLKIIDNRPKEEKKDE